MIQACYWSRNKGLAQKCLTNDHGEDYYCVVERLIPFFPAFGNHWRFFTNERCAIHFAYPSHGSRLLLTSARHSSFGRNEPPIRVVEMPVALTTAPRYFIRSSWISLFCGLQARLIAYPVTCPKERHLMVHRSRRVVETETEVCVN